MSIQHYFKPAYCLTFETVMADKAKLIALLQSAPFDKLHCDLSDVQTCDSAGLALLMDIRRLCDSHHAKLEMTSIPKNVCALAILYGVEEILLGVKGV